MNIYPAKNAKYNIKRNHTLFRSRLIVITDLLVLSHKERTPAIMRRDHNYYSLARATCAYCAHIVYKRARGKGREKG